jgi:hypothetical protein
MYGDAVQEIAFDLQLDGGQYDPQKVESIIGALESATTAQLRDVTKAARSGAYALGNELLALSERWCEAEADEEARRIFEENQEKARNEQHDTH